MTTRISLLIAILAILGAAAPIAGGAHPAWAVSIHGGSISDVRLFADGSAVAGAWSSLRTGAGGADVTVSTSELPAGNAVTLWWVIFNHPEKCTHGHLGLRCGGGDLLAFGGDPAVGSSVLYADGHVIGGAGKGNYHASLATGDATGALFGNGLTNPLGADIHLVLHSHGPVIPGLVHEQTHSFGAGCNNVPPGTGTPGPNTCEDIQFSAHEQ